MNNSESTLKSCATRLAGPLGRALTAFSLGLILWGCCTLTASAAAFVSETPREFLTSGDFNGDGILDVLVLDKATGNARVGYQDGNGALTWSAPLITGVVSPEGFAVGRFIQTNQDAVAVTSAELNRVHLVDLSNPSNAPAPAVLVPSGIGPNLLIGLSAPYGVVSDFDWITVGSGANSHDIGVTLVELFAFLGDALSSYQDSVSQQAYLARGNSVRLGADPETYAAAIQRDTNDQFVVYAPSNHFSVLLTRSNLPPGSDYAFGQFNSEALPRFLFYVPGQSNLTVQSLVPTNSGFSFDAGITVDLAEAIQNVYYVSQDADGSAVIVFGDGVQGLTLPGGTPSLSAVYRSGGGSAGNVFTGIVPLSNGNFTLLDGPPGNPSSAHAQVMLFDHTNFTQQSDSILPATTTRGTRANVWLFQTEPFVSDDPGFISSLNDPDWSDGVSGLPGTLAVRKETDAGSSSGLSDAATDNPGAPPAGAAFALPDQYTDFISLFTYSSARAPEAVKISISPVAGLYGGPIQISFTTFNLSDQVFYRVGSLDSWHAFVGAFTLTNDATIQCYATNATLAARSHLLAASYSFGASGIASAPPVDLAPGTTNPAPPFQTNLVILSDVGTAFYGRHSYNSNYTIWAINLDGSGETYLTDGARPRVSRDGRWLAFEREGVPFIYQANLWVRDLLTGQETRLLNNSSQLVCYDWDLTETNLVFDNNCRFWTVGLSGGPAPFPLGGDCGQEAPVVNPVDGRIAFHDLNANGPPGLYLAPQDLSSRQYLTLNATSGHRWPAWSPDGQALSFADGPFSAAIDAGKNLWIVRLGPGGLTNQLYQITSFGFSDNSNGFPHGALWSPQGDALVGGGTMFGTNGIWIIPLTPDGTDCEGPPILLPTSPGNTIDFVGSIVAAPSLPQRVVTPGLFIRLDPDAAVVYWGAIFAGFTLEYTPDLTAPATWTPIPGPYDFDGYFYLYREPLANLLNAKFFRLHKQ